MGVVGVILQSGGTPETRNGLLEVQRAFREAGLNFAKQVLISGSSFCLCAFFKSSSGGNCYMAIIQINCPSV